MVRVGDSCSEFGDFIGSSFGSFAGGGLPLLLFGLLVVIVTPILPDSFDNTSAFLLVPTGSRLLRMGRSSLLLLLLPSAVSVAGTTGGGVGDVARALSTDSKNQIIKITLDIDLNLCQNTDAHTLSYFWFRQGIYSLFSSLNLSELKGLTSSGIFFILVHIDLQLR